MSAPSKYRHAYLMGTLLLLIGLGPFFEGAAWGAAAVRILLLASLGAAAFSCASSRRQLMAYAAIGVPAIASGTIWWATEAELVRYVYFVSSAACCVFVVVLILRQIIRAERISSDTIYGAVAVYLLLGLLWTFAFAVLEVTARGSFDFGERVVAAEGGIGLIRQMLGFSYTTLTTLGYGNIAPMTPRADALATMEAIVGQIYLAVLVARLVGLHVGQAMLKAGR